MKASSMAHIYRVTRAHKPDHGDPLLLTKGEVVPFERRRTKWDGWLWCSKPNGESGWIPESWVKIQEDNCVVERDYNARELAVRPGEMLDAILTESGWVMARSSTGTIGWVPLECVELTATELR